MFWLAGLSLGFISLANLAFRGTLGSEPSTGFTILAGSGMLRLRLSLETPEFRRTSSEWSCACVNAMGFN
jgi:hypothetical protein